MNILIVGYGSMGKRRHVLLQQLRPSWEVVIYDPLEFVGKPMPEAETVDAVIIASPHTRHADVITWCSYTGKKAIPCLVEKPLGMRQLPAYYSEKSIVGFNFRFHKQWDDIAQMASSGHLSFTAYENLVQKYGRTVAETAGSHAFDMALRLLGPATGVEVLPHGVCLSSNGITMNGFIEHANGESRYDYDMNYNGRFVSIDNGRGKLLELERDETCYLREMEAWIRLLETGERDARLASLEDGVRVEEIIAQVQHD